MTNSLRKTEPLVTALITNYNHGSYLRACIESALGQTYPRVQVLVVDDGSTDSSRDTLESFGGAIDVLLKPNGGQASAFNAGIDAAQGELICFLDSDDEWMPTKVAEVVDRYRTTEASLIYNQFVFVGTRNDPTPYPKRMIDGDLKALSEKSGGWWPYPPTSALSFPTAFLRDLGPVPESSFRICADAYLADSAPYFGRVEAIERPLTEYRLHDSNNWTTSTRISGAAGALRSNATQYEMRVDSLNRLLESRGLGGNVTLADHWPYWRAKWLAGDAVPLTKLIRLALGFQGQPRKLARVKALGEAIATKRRMKSSVSDAQ